MKIGKLIQNPHPRPLSQRERGDSRMATASAEWVRALAMFFVGVLILGFVLAGDASARKILYYRNPMNPQITSETPQKDSMGMDYVPVYAEPAESKGEVAKTSGFYISAEKQQLIGVKSELVRKMKLIKKISAVGKVAYNPETYLGSSEGKIWLYIYEADIPYVKVGQKVKLLLPSNSGKTYIGKISSINPIMNPETRTANFRVDVSKGSSDLLPGMFLSAQIEVNLGKRIAVLRDAILDTGTTQKVFVDRGNGRFEEKEVKLGVKADPYIEIVSGIKESEKIVTSGNFLLDSEARIRHQ